MLLRSAPRYFWHYCRGTKLNRALQEGLCLLCGRVTGSGGFPSAKALHDHGAKEDCLPLATQTLPAFCREGNSLSWKTMGKVASIMAYILQGPAEVPIETPPNRSPPCSWDFPDASNKNLTRDFLCLLQEVTEGLEGVTRVHTLSLRQIEKTPRDG